ncbi:MAG: hypothetical protein ACRERY_11580 [Pseudomonas sp.]
MADHQLYEQLGVDGAERQQAYRQLFLGHMEPTALQSMRDALTHSYPLGNDRFRDEIERQLGRTEGHSNRGRPVVKNKSLRPL